MSREGGVGTVASTVALLAACSALSASQFDVVVSEIHYNPLSGLPGDEFLEIHNRGPTAADVSGWAFTEGISVVLAPGTVLEPGSFLVLSPDPPRTRALHSIGNVHDGPYSGRLDNDGEIITLRSASGEIIARLHYGDEDIWPSRPDGRGPTLELLDAWAPPDIDRSWGASRIMDGTPGGANSRWTSTDPYLPPESPVELNEVKPTGPGGPAFIELFNESPSSVSLSGHAIVDSLGRRHDFSPTASVPGLGRLVVLESELGHTIPLAASTYVLVEEEPGTGEDLFVGSMETRAVPAGGSFGRYPDGNDDAYVLTTPTQGAANQHTRVDDVVINEIHFHPPWVAPGGGCAAECSDARQWMELHNRGTSPVNLAGWTLSKAVDFTFPSVSIPAGGYVVAASSRTVFLAQHPGFDSTRVVGDWLRDLAHDADTINLNDALGNRVDHVRYSDGRPVNDVEPADEVDDRTFAGSTWPANTDGTGRTLELVNPRLDNRLGGAWAAGPVGGTPGAANGAFSAAPSGSVDDVSHSPAVPLPGEEVTVTCRVGSVGAVAAVEVLWHREGSGASGTVALADDGLSGDGAAGNGVYGGAIPPQPDGSIVGFQVRLRLADGKVTLVPRSPAVSPYSGFDGPYFLYQVLSAPPLPNPSVDYFIVMTLEDEAELASRPETSNVLLPCTFIEVEPDGSGNVKHLAGIRYRGEATRREARKPYRVAFPSENMFRGIKRLNLNSFQAENEMLVSDLFRRAGMPYPQEWMVNLTFQGDTDPGYVRKERMDGDFTTRFFGGASDSGSFYRALDPPDFPDQGDLSYFGEDAEDYVPYYEKRRDTENPDYSDIIELCRAFDPDETPDAVFADRIEELIDPDEWARYFAIQSLISNNDGSIQTGTGEDYLLYRVPASSGRLDAGKWLLVPWDIEESFTNSTERLFRPSLPAVRRFLLHPRFTPLYYESLTKMRTGAFSRQEMRKSYPLVDFVVGGAEVDELDLYVRERNAFIEAAFPLELTAGSLSSQGEFVIAPGELWRYWKGTAAPAGTTFAWTQKSYGETGWLTGATGIGYGDQDDATPLLDMEDSYTSIYARKTFQLSSAGSADGMQLSVDYDDGFVAYLNGFEVARRNVGGSPGTAVPFDDTAQVPREAGFAEDIDLDAHLGRLDDGENVLSFQVLNQAIDSTDVSFIPELTITGLGGGGSGCGLIHASGPTLRLQGTSNAFLTQSVLVNGELAEWDSAASLWTITVALAPGENAFLVESYPAPGGLGGAFAEETVIVRRIDRDPVPVSGTLPAGLTRWTEAAGPYLIRSRVTVPAGARLEIGPGTVVMGAADAGILVRGEIQALGTGGAPIVFLPSTCSEPWGGIAIEATGTGAAAPTHVLQNVRIEGAQAADGLGALSTVGSKVVVERSAFEKVGPALTAGSSTVTLRDSSFSGITGEADAIRIDGGGQARSAIERCRIEGGPDDGIFLSLASVDLRENFISGAAAAGISISDDGSLGGAALTGNILHGCGTGLWVHGGGHVTGDHNTIAGNGTGLLLSRRGGGAEGGHADLHSTIVWSNTVDVSVDAESSVNFTFSDTGGGALPGAGNISSHPRFIDFLEPDYGLRSASPCIGTGMEATDMGAIPFGGSTRFIRMDADGSGTVNLTDAIGILDYLFREGEPPACLDAADGNDSGEVDISDPLSILFYLFRGGITPAPPFPEPGTDPTEDALGC